jgi:hypothetical protein
MRKIAIAAALLSAIGSGAALAQGCPPGGAWRSGWPGYPGTGRAQTMATHQADSVAAGRGGMTTKSNRPLTSAGRGVNAGD